MLQHPKSNRLVSTFVSGGCYPHMSRVRGGLQAHTGVPDTVKVDSYLSAFALPLAWPQ